MSVLLGTAGIGITVSAAATAPSRDHSEPAIVARSAAAASVFSDPATLIPPTNDETSDGIPVGLGTSARLTRAKVNLVVPSFVAFTYPFAPSSFANGFGLPSEFRPRRPDSTCAYGGTGFKVSIWAADFDNARHQFRSVGEFPAAQVSLLAFGSIPVTATLHIRQLVRAGKAEPLVLYAPGQLVSVKKDDPKRFLGRSGCDPSWEQSQALPTVAIGRVDAFVTDVKIDGKPVPVGDTCRTSSPIQVQLNGQDEAHGGKYGNVLAGGVLEQRKDHRGSGSAHQVDWYPGSTNLTIPAFTGCRTRTGDDLSRLITATVSGPDNTLAVSQAAPFFNLSPPLSTQDPRSCTPDGICPYVPDAPVPPVPG